MYEWLLLVKSELGGPLFISGGLFVRFLTSLANSLNSIELLCASHLCRLLIIWCTASFPSVSIPVLGYSHSHRSQDSSSAAFSASTVTWEPPSNDLIQLTELHEYLLVQFEPLGQKDAATTLAPDEANASSGTHSSRPLSDAVHRNFSAYKLIYAQRLLEAGLLKQALSCCRELSMLIRSEKLPQKVLCSQIKALAMKALLEDRAFYSSFVTRRNSFSNALPSWLLELDVVGLSTPSQHSNLS